MAGIGQKQTAKTKVTILPISAVPVALQPLFWLNPLAVIVENFRRVVIWGLPPDWLWLGVVTLLSGLVMLGGGYVVHENQAGLC